MRYSFTLLALASAGLISAVPLNINLGAYSPALVVGDGEISFGGAENAGQLMQTLATGAQTAGAAAGGEGGAAAPAPEAQAANAAAPPAIGALVGAAPAGEQRPAGEANAAVVETPASDIIPENPQASVVSPDAAAASADPALAGMISKGMNPSLKIPAPAVLPRPNMAKRDLPPRSPVPAPVAEPTADDEDLSKREAELAAATEKLRLKERAFGEALNYALQAMQNQPAVELGTGREGSGVGVIVNPGKNVPANSAAAGRVAPSVRGGGEGAAAPAAAARKRYVMPGAGMGAEAEAPKSGITLMAIAEI